MGTSTAVGSKLTTNGITVPADFPVGPYEDIHAAVLATRTGDPVYDHYAGASNAVAFRFKAAIEYGDAFAESVTRYGASPEPEQRFEQEKALFGFFSSGFSALESVFFELYVLGAFVKVAGFPLATPRDQQLVTPKRTVDAFGVSFPGDTIQAAFAIVFSDSGYQSFRETRNVLTHRAAPGRRMYVSIGTDDEVPTEWKLNNLPLDGTISTKGRGDLARLMTELLVAGAKFSKANLK